MFLTTPSVEIRPRASAQNCTERPGRGGLEQCPTRRKRTRPSNPSHPRLDLTHDGCHLRLVLSAPGIPHRHAPGVAGPSSRLPPLPWAVCSNACSTRACSSTSPPREVITARPRGSARLRAARGFAPSRPDRGSIRCTPMYTDPMREWLGPVLPGSLLILDEARIATRERDIREHGLVASVDQPWR